MHSRPRRLSRFALGAAILLTFAMIAPAGAAQPTKKFTAKDLSPSGRVQGFKSVSSGLVESDPALLGRKDGALVNVMIKLDYDATASYAGGVDGLAATSPQVTGKALDRRSPAVAKYAAYVASQEAAFVKALKTKVPKAVVGQSYRTVYGGISARIPANAVKDVLAIKGAVAVQADRILKLDTDSSPNFLGANSVYPQLGGTKKAGQGIIFGDLDTGLWPEHPSFADQGVLAAPPARPDGTARTCDFGDNPLTPAADVFVCQNKLIGGEPFLATYNLVVGGEVYTTARDSNGHGTHTSSTAAGDVLTTAPVLGVDRGPIHGIAPGAHIIEYKVCGAEGCFTSDSAAAVQEAINDGVDVINFSISGGTQPFADPVELAFLDAYAAGVFVATSAGNEGPGAGTANHLSPWVVSTAASTQRREFRSTLTVTGASRSVVFTGASITAGAGPLPVVLSSAAPYSNAQCSAPAAPSSFTGKIVACQRGGGIARVEKGFNVLQGGAAGMILYNPTLADVETDNHWLPTVHLADGTAFLAFLAANPGATATFTAGAKANGQGDVMAAFSSRGPAGNFIKPDLSAPGVQILAGNTPTPESIVEGPPGQYFQAIAGTSMSSPHVAGAAILGMDAHPSWTPGQVKSALMLTATTNVVKEDTTTPADPFDMGAGRIRIGSADDSPLTIDATAHDMFLMANNPITAINVNLPSINAPVMPGRIETTREVKNVSGQRQRFDVSTLGGPDTKITVTPDRFTINNNQTQVLRIKIESSAPDGVQQFATIKIDGNKPGPVVHLPVAFVHKQGNVNLSQSCWQTSIPKNRATVCDVTATNNTFDDQVVDLDSTVSSKLRIIGANGATIVTDRHARLHNVALAGAEEGVPSVAPGELAGYVPLDSFGIAPDAIGDEEILNYSVPTFLYNGVEYETLGVDSNGYVVIGGGSSEDNNCCNIPAGPDPAKPNNMIAPFWTDLDGSAAPGIFAAILTDGVDDWIVIEYRVHVFGTTDLRTFQTWIGINGSQDITYAYAAAQTDPNGQDFLVGAENQAGNGDMVAVLPTEDLRVTSTDPTPGESATYSLIILGVATGTGTLTSSMGATGVPGTTIVKTNITVTAH
jgi:subtilase family protein/PA domain-containing protein/fibronectin type III domain protein